MLTKFIVVAVSQCIHISNHYVVHLTLMQYFRSIVTKKWQKRAQGLTGFSGEGGMNRWNTHAVT